MFNNIKKCLDAYENYVGKYNNKTVTKDMENALVYALCRDLPMFNIHYIVCKLNMFRSDNTPEDIRLLLHKQFEEDFKKVVNK